MLNYILTIIEAYNQRIPLIICTADRPAYLRNTGANQTINQDNIYKNHIRYFCDFGLPSLSTSKLKSFSNKIVKGIVIGSELNNGPIHFNFPFKKPLEPEIFSDEINYRVADFIKQTKKVRKVIPNNNEVKKIIEKIKSSARGIIFLGWGNFDKTFYEALIKFSQNSNFQFLQMEQAI
ncbi:MAG: hypothetical protein H6613_14105 [Ignavibacteriales bacterium]|nr:hypothetical protein [Ignavibacteriales bacterium]